MVLCSSVVPSALRQHGALLQRETVEDVDRTEAHRHSFQAGNSGGKIQEGN